ncbi:ABC transporter ATP-binding protein uup [Rhodopseudomonas palustris]|uniref:ATP-binding protein Uup n=1 Tax=Rhodopseudomonas palustris (strain ATCC BAA-98 / CGA009) TaxID=258594 RepID=Q6N7R6_RHOPA|nr:ATP-binding cassette domain-containing protein [Rhodopseudomonas palustris]OPF90532.1 elongation factor 3 [Rhodopseudomonas palustris]QQM03703.1 ABC transporter ATP-binding protein uup [Rhodopseudomonas palustris]RJF61786.1 ATP-binding cassette domain-containing protein [Rhodopseudomonas palustris]WAB79843.1 ATP-binding cassette domain-containing protein [Rhodopseudomonas palustris]WCL92345.1 ATP-binding cassette domain-containing protein [Rhodopseudomonas palustris CGA009]
MAPPLIQLKDIALTFGGAALFDGVELAVSAGDRLCLIGRNGSGKSTLLKIVAGLIEPDRGSRFVQPGATVRYLPQEPDFDGFATTQAYVEAGLAPGDDHYQAAYLLEQLGLHGDENPAHLSGGEARRAALARILAPDPDILLLDEPTNHLDLTTIEWLENDLAQRRCAIVMISHDRRFLSNLSRATAWLDRGVIRQIDRGFSQFESWRDDVLAEEERDQHKLDRKIVMEEHWLRYGVSGRRKRNVKRLAGLHELRAQRRDYRGPTGAASLAAAEADKSGKLVIEAKSISKAWGDRPIVDAFSIRINRGDRVGIVGPNGAGKTTLISLLTGALAPDSGTVRLGTNLEIATLDQSRDSLDPKSTLSDALTGGRGDQVMVGGKPRHVIGYMKDFLFTQEQARTPLEALSGGERGRLMLARSLANPSNLLVLDEPTNDLDLETLDVLEEMLGDYDGTVILISHDRDFLDRVVTSVIAPDGGGKWIEYAGGYSDMLAQRGADLSRQPAKAAAAEPAAAKAAPSPATAPAPKRKLSFNEKHALETLPKTIAKLEAEIADLQKQLDDPQLFARDRAKFDKVSAAMAKAHDELHAAEHRWLELEMLREEIESA